MPSPVSATDDDRARADARRATPSTLTARRRELDRVDEQVPDHLLQPIGIAEHGIRELRVGSVRLTPLASAAGRTASSAASTTGARSIGRSSSRSLPVTIRETSRMSAISCSCRCAFRSIVSSARVEPASIEPAHCAADASTRASRSAGCAARATASRGSLPWRDSPPRGLRRAAGDRPRAASRSVMSRTTSENPRRSSAAPRTGVRISVRVEQRAAAADARPLALDPAVVFRGREMRRGHAGGLVGDRVEAREAAADDLVRGVAEQPFRAGVPAGDLAVAAQHADRVVLHAVEEQAQAILGLAQPVGADRRARRRAQRHLGWFPAVHLGARDTRDAACGSVRRRIQDPAPQLFPPVSGCSDRLSGSGCRRRASGWNGTASPIERPTGETESSARRASGGAARGPRPTEPDRCRSSGGCGRPPGATDRRPVRDRHP